MLGFLLFKKGTVRVLCIGCLPILSRYFLCLACLPCWPSPEEFFLQTSKDEGRGRSVVAVGDCLRFGDIKSQQSHQQSPRAAGGTKGRIDRYNWSRGYTLAG